MEKTNYPDLNYYGRVLTPKGTFQYFHIRCVMKNVYDSTGEEE